MKRKRFSTRAGAVLPLVVLCMIGLVGLLALAIDIGMVAVARSQCQNAADAAAMAGARTINGKSDQNYNFDQVPKNAVAAALQNYILNVKVQGDTTKITQVNAYTFESGNVKVETGAYTYKYNDANPSSEGFEAQFPRLDSAEPYTAARVTVKSTNDFAFGRIFGMGTFNTNAVATAVHRPRDVMIIMDLSGSMRFQSLPGIYINSSKTASPSSSSVPRNVSMNGETVYPKFGHYSDTTGAALFGNTAFSTGSEQVDPANISFANNSGPAIALDFYANAYGVDPSSGNRAFSRSSDAYDAAPGGLNFLRTNSNTSGNPYAKTVNEITAANAQNEINWELSGYDSISGVTFKDYTEGPGYWGKTFFIWPPDPRGATKTDATDFANHADNGAKDWRQRFFFKYNTGTSKLAWLDHDNILFEPSGAPATASNPTPGTPVMRLPNSSITVTENGSSVTYQLRINYAAILHWLKSSPAHFPTQLRAGRICYYNAWPDTTDKNLNTRMWSTTAPTNVNERFWKEYIDFVLGFCVNTSGAYSRTNRDPDGNNLSSVPVSALIGNGDYYTWGTMKISQRPDKGGTSGGRPYNTAAKPSSGYSIGATSINITGATLTPPAGVPHYVKFSNHSTVYKLTGTPTKTSITLASGLTTAVTTSTGVTYYFIPYMDYDDNPHRPRHQLWFGPMTFIDFLGNYNTQRFWWPGNVHEAQAWAAKVGIQTAIDDIKNNHPSDFVGLVFFSSPKYSASGGGQHNKAVVPLGRNYQMLKDSLWFPPSTINDTSIKEITPYDEDFDNVPRAKGGTAPGMGFMIAYNLLSSSYGNLRSYAQPQPKYRGSAGGLGRRGASRLIIFETDGAPNTSATATLVSSGKDSYYPVRIKYPDKLTDTGNTEWPANPSYANSQVYDVVKQVCALDTATPPGYSTSRKPFLIYPIAYGSLFEPKNTSSTQTAALDFMQTVGFHGNTTSSTSGGDFPDWQRIYGTNTERIDRMQAAFQKIMQSGVQVSLIE